MRIKMNKNIKCCINCEHARYPNGVIIGSIECSYSNEGGCWEYHKFTNYCSNFKKNIIR